MELAGSIMDTDEVGSLTLALVEEVGNTAGVGRFAPDDRGGNDGTPDGEKTDERLESHIETINPCFRSTKLEVGEAD
jgi:hypothetical protein